MFTAASQDYADFILNVLDPDGALIQHRLYRQHTIVTEDGVYVKDLSRLGRDLRRTVIVDNIKENFERQDANGFEIKTWVGDAQDRELEALSIFLRGLVDAQVRDVRPLLKLFKEGSHGSSPTQWRKRSRMIPIYKKESSTEKASEAKFIR